MQGATLPTATIPVDLDGARLDAVLRHFHPELSRTQVRQLCELGAASLAGVRCPNPTDRVRAGLSFAFDPATAPATLALGMPVVHQDDDTLVLHKPPGLAVHGGPLVDDSVAERLAAAFPGEGAGLAHRLDRGASGLLLVGMHRAALQSLGEAMERGQIERDYLAIVLGTPAEDRFTVDLPLRIVDEPRGNQPKAVVDREGGQAAVSHVVVLDRKADLALVAVSLATGRTHQIRAHLAAVGHPLLGDDRYGEPVRNRKAHDTWGVQRVLLHGTRLEFPQPASGATVTVQAVHEPDFARVFRSLRG